MKLIVFDVCGYIAHFRKFFSSVTSLSYVFPPRTAIIGLISAIMGFERDGYYELFSDEKCKIALQILTPVRRLPQKLNYLMTKKISVKHLRGLTVHAQPTVELVMREGTNLDIICYRIFFNHIDKNILNSLEKNLRDKKYFYPPALGSLNNLAEVNYIGTLDAKLIIEGDKEISISTVIPTKVVRELAFMEDRKIFLEENVPADFTINRSISRTENYIYEGNGKQIKCKVNCEVFRINVMGDELNGVFM